MFIASYRNTQAGIDRRRAQERRVEPPRQIEPPKGETPPTAAPVVPMLPAVDHLAYLDMPRRRPAREIIAMVAAWTDVPVEEILGRSHKKVIVAARMDAVVAVYLNCLVQGEPMSMPRLGRMFDRDHTSILHTLHKRGVR